MTRARSVVGFVVLAALAGTAFGVVRMRERAGARDSAAKDDKAERPVVVAVSPVEQRDVPIDLDGIGSVAAYKTVTIKPQVDGRLDSVMFKEGDEVKRGQPLAQIDPRPYQIQLHQAEGNLARDQALLTDSQLNLDRYTKLTGQKFIAQQQLDDQQGLLGQYQGAVQGDQAQIESAKLNLTYARIVSPIDGVTGVRLVDPGNYVRASDTTGLVVVTQLDPISVLFTLPQDDLPTISEHMAGGAKLTVDAFDRSGTKLLATGELLLIDNQINQTTATIRMKAVFPNPKRVLWPNQFVKTRLHVTARKGVLVVPSTAVQRGPKGTFAYVANANDTVSARPIEIELSLSDLTILKSGLKLGERVVVEGQNQLRDGAKIKARGNTP